MLDLLQDNCAFNWDEIVGLISDSFRMDFSESERLKKNKVAKLIGAIPFLAGCNNPLRTSLSNIATYIIAAKSCKIVFNHNVYDDYAIMNRLACINNFDGGNLEVINKGMNLLCLVMINGYKRDLENDKYNHKYNPLLSKKWDYKKTRKELKERILSVKSLEMDKIFNINEAVFAYWTY